MKKILLSLASCLLILASCSDNPAVDGGSNQDTIPLLVTRIQQCSRLYTTEMHLHKIIVHNDTKTLNGKILSQDFNVDLPLGTRKVAIPMNATVRAYIDFSDFSAENVRREGQKIEIILPDPKISEPITKIAHDEIKAYVPFLRRQFSDEELSKYEQAGRKAIVQELPDLGIVEQAKANAARTLIPLIEQLGFAEADITITFRKQYTPQEIRRLVEQPLSKQMK